MGIQTNQEEDKKASGEPDGRTGCGYFARAFSALYTST